MTTIVKKLVDLVILGLILSSLGLLGEAVDTMQFKAAHACKTGIMSLGGLNRMLLNGGGPEVKKPNDQNR